MPVSSGCIPMQLALHREVLSMMKLIARDSAGRRFWYKIAKLLFACIAVAYWATNFAAAEDYPCKPQDPTGSPSSRIEHMDPNYLVKFHLGGFLRIPMKPTIDSDLKP